MEIINLQNVRKIFDNNEVIKSCNMSVKKGSIYGFLGRNGAGKTTVLKLIAGLLQPTSGTITLEIKDRHQKNIFILLRRKQSFKCFTCFLRSRSAG